MNVPQLRFDGFDGEWKEFSFEQVATITMGQSPSGDSYNTSKEGEPLINGPTEFGDIYPTPVQWTTKPSKFSKPGDTLLCVRGSSIGRMNLSDSRYCIGRGVAAISGLDNKTISAYMKYVLEKEVEKILKRSTGSTFPNISGHELKQSRISVPNLKEQEKIAKFLTALDYKREKQQEKIEKLEQFKKGMMQKIFTQELRFKNEDGREFPEWQLKELKDIADVIGGGTPSTSNESYWNGNIPWFTPTEISNEKYVNQSKRTISEEGLKKSSAKVLPAGTILLTTRATLGDMAIATEPVTTNQGFQSIVPKENSVGEFIYYLQPQIKKHCLVNASGSTFMEISKSNLETFTTLIPSKKEQIKISSYLSKLDLKIEKEEEKLMVLKEQKRGFMQGLFI